MGVKPQSGRYSTRTETEIVCPEGFTLLIYESHRVRYMFMCGVTQREWDNPFKTFFHHWKCSSHTCVRWFFSFVLEKVRIGRMARQSRQTIWRMRSCPWALLLLLLLHGARQGAKPSGSWLVLFHWVSEMLSSFVFLFIPILPFQDCKRKYFKSLTNHPSKHSWIGRVQGEQSVSSDGGVQGHTWVKHCAQTRGQDSPCHTDIVKVAPTCPRADSELAQTHALQSQANGNYRALQQDAGGLTKSAVLDLTSKYKVKKHDYCPLLGSGEAHLDCCILSGAPQCERQCTGAKCHQDM